jgi:hypothetical protein
MKSKPKLDSNILLESDDEFEEFPVEEWHLPQNEENLWDDMWDNEEVDHNFEQFIKQSFEQNVNKQENNQ